MKTIKPAQPETSDTEGAEKVDEIERENAAEKKIVDLIRRLILAARDGRAHMSHEDGKSCMGCNTVREAQKFVQAMLAE